MRVYFSTPHGTWPASRPAGPQAGPQQALDALLAGPTAAERARGLTSALPEGQAQVTAYASGRGQVDLFLPWVIPELDPAAVNQLVCTAAAAPAVAGGLPSTQIVVRVNESGPEAKPWAATCDATGTATATDRETPDVTPSTTQEVRTLPLAPRSSAPKRERAL